MLLRNIFFYLATFFLFAHWNQPIHAQQTTVASKLRIDVSKIEVRKRKPNKVVICCTLTNPGNQPIMLGNYKSGNPIPIIYYDASISIQNLIVDKDSISKAILEQHLNLTPGQEIKKVKLEYVPKGYINKDIKTKTILKDTITTPIITTPTKDSSIANINNNLERYPDLVIESLKIVKQKKKYARITYNIVNKGNDPAPLFGESSKTEDNLVLRVYLSGTTKLTRGSITVGEVPIEENRFFKASLLQPGQVYQGVVDVSLENKTKYTSVVILYIDAYQNITESNRANNINAIILK